MYKFSLSAGDFLFMEEKFSCLLYPWYIPSRVTNNFDYRNNNIFNFLDLLNKDIRKKLRLFTYMS